MSGLRKLYLFLDEGGNFDFTAKGSKYFSISCITTERPFHLFNLLDAYRYDCIEHGLPQEYFHCTDDNRHVRQHLFAVIGDHLDTMKIDSVIVKKGMIEQWLQEPKHFYPRMLGYLIRHVINDQDRDAFGEVIVITDLIPAHRKKDAIEKAVKLTLADMLPQDARYRILHHASRAHYGLQIVDYCNWAIFRKWERGDDQHYKQIVPAIRSEANIYLGGEI